MVSPIILYREGEYSVDATFESEYQTLLTTNDESLLIQMVRRYVPLRKQLSTRSKRKLAYLCYVYKTICQKDALSERLNDLTLEEKYATL